MAMNRRGAALFVALVVVLLGGLVVVVAAMAATAEIRAGMAWDEHQTADGLAASAVVNAGPALDSVFDSLSVGERLSINDTVNITRLGDSMALVAVSADSRLGEARASTVVRAVRDSTGEWKLGVPGRPRVRFHPIP
jgi:Tfp pilus assembly protein PilX